LKNVVIIDGTNFFIRFFSADKSIDKFGNPCGGFTGTINGIKNIIRLFTPDEIVFVMDGKNNSKRKQKIDESYKNGRKMGYVELLPQDNKNSFDKQLSKLYLFIDYLPIKLIITENIEADDAIAYINNLYLNLNDDLKTIIVSRDNDFYQLITDRTVVYDPYKKITIGQTIFEEEYGLNSKNYHLFKTFAGDVSDNVKRIFNKKKIFEYFADILKSEETITYFELEKYIKEKEIGVDLEQVKNNFDLVSLHDPNISLEFKRILSNKIKDNSKKRYGMLNLKIQIQVFGIEGKVYADFFDYINLYKLKNNKFVTEVFKQ